MVNVSDAWKKKQLDVLAPEGFVEISYLVSEDGLQESATASSAEETYFSEVEKIVDIVPEVYKKRYATNEMNLWVLDGSRNVLPNSDADNTGYVSSKLNTGTVSITLDEVHEQPLQGVTIQWCEEFGEYATDFTVTAYNGNTAVATKDVTGNNDVTSVVELDIADYDGITITVTKWSNPYHKVRIEQVTLGVTKIYLKSDLMSFKHEQTGSLVSGELPKNSIEFTLSNEDGKWNPNNPQGNERYLSERQKLKVRYGFDIDGTTEWVNAGTFYLSEWKTPSNGLQATFTARDLLEYMIDKSYTGRMSGTLYEIAENAVELTDLPAKAEVYLDERLKDYTASFEGEYSIAEVLQMCANAARCVIYQDRSGVLRLEYKNDPVGDYAITGNVSYSYPEFELSKPLKSIVVGYGEDSEYVYAVGKEGEIQTLDNPFISEESQAKEVAQWLENSMKFRKNISGSYRADPRLDVFDKIRIEGKYGTNNAVVITNISYSFTGAFRGTYEGVVTEFTPVNAGYSGEFYAGEVY